MARSSNWLGHLPFTEKIYGFEFRPRYKCPSDERVDMRDLRNFECAEGNPGCRTSLIRRKLSIKLCNKTRKACVEKPKGFDNVTGSEGSW